MIGEGTRLLRVHAIVMVIDEVVVPEYSGAKEDGAVLLHVILRHMPR